MRTKALSFTLAGVLSIQSFAFAGAADRTADIGNQAIATAQNHLQTLNHQILLLDQSLSDTEQAIAKRDDRGGITNALAVGSAGLGIALSAMSYFTFRGAGEGSGIGGMFLATFAVGAGINSLVNGAISQRLKTPVDPNTLQNQLVEAQKGVDAAIAENTDKNRAALLIQMSNSIKNTQQALTEYVSNSTSVTQNRLTSQGAQLVGTGILIYGLTHANSAAPMIGLMVSNVGNLGAVLTGFQKEHADEILKEIKETRESLKTVSAALQ